MLHSSRVMLYAYLSYFPRALADSKARAWAFPVEGQGGVHPIGNFSPHDGFLWAGIHLWLIPWHLFNTGQGTRSTKGAIFRYKLFLLSRLLLWNTNSFQIIRQLSPQLNGWEGFLLYNCNLGPLLSFSPWSSFSAQNQLLFISKGIPFLKCHFLNREHNDNQLLTTKWTRLYCMLLFCWGSHYWMCLTLTL